MNRKLIIAVVGVVLAAAGGGAFWYMNQAAPQDVVQQKPEPEKKLTKYVTLDKVIVMLRRAPNQQAAHYLSIDIVLATTPELEKETKDQLPLLRSIAVATLSSRTLSEAAGMTVDQFAEQLTKTFDASYAKENHLKPFSEVMISKLIIE